MPRKVLPSRKLRWPLYFKAVRPWTAPDSLTPIILGTILAYNMQNTFDLTILILTTLTVLCIHSAGNLVNTYYDFKYGIDSPRSDDRILVDRVLTPNDVVWFGGVLYTAACFFFLTLASISPARIEMLSLVYFGGMSSSFLYTGGIGFKYVALGPLVVIFAYMAQYGSSFFTLLPVFYAVPVAMHTEAVLHSNNVRDANADKLAGIVTLAILIGPLLSYVLFCVLLILPYVLFFAYTMNWSWTFILPFLSIYEAFKIEENYRLNSADLDLPARMARLVLIAGLLYVTAIALANTDHLPFYGSEKN